MLYTLCCESAGLVNEFTIKPFDNYVVEIELFNSTLTFSRLRLWRKSRSDPTLKSGRT
jgi:hypothetical protein